MQEYDIVEKYKGILDGVVKGKKCYRVTEIDADDLESWCGEND